MNNENVRVLSASDMAAISQNLSQIRNTVPATKALTPAERRSLFKLSDNRIGFVVEAFSKMKSNPSLVPSYVDILAAQKLLHLYNQLNEIGIEMQKLQEKIENTKLQAGNQALLISKMFYHQTKNAATLGLKDAENITIHLNSLYTVGRNAKAKKKKNEEG